MVGDSIRGQCFTQERFEAWWAWQVAQFQWADSAQTCLDMMRAESAQ